MGRAAKKCSYEVRFHENILCKSVACVKSSLNLNLNFHVINNEWVARAFCFCFERSISIMLRDLQGVFHLRSLQGDKNEALILKPARDGQPGEIDREQEKTCQPRYIYYQTSYHRLRFHPSPCFRCFSLRRCCIPFMDA